MRFFKLCMKNLSHHILEPIYLIPSIFLLYGNLRETKIYEQYYNHICNKSKSQYCIQIGKIFHPLPPNFIPILVFHNN